MQLACTIPHGYDTLILPLSHRARINPLLSGPANVTLLDTTGGGDGVVIGGKLAEFTDFCPLSGDTPADRKSLSLLYTAYYSQGPIRLETNLQFTLPSATDVGTKCQKAGDCVVQLFWATPDLAQNYYYCTSFPQSTSQIPGLIFCFSSKVWT